jgi:hypothetical protein
MSIEWDMVPALDEGRDQLNKRFPKRSKKAEGGIGDKAHQGRTSSHNPDDASSSGIKAEYNDHDGKHEVRARDFDKNLNDDHGVTMEQVVQAWLKALRAGRMKWVRYIIYAGRIWHRRDNFVTHAYTGSNKHYDHAHVNGDFTSYADTVRNTDWEVANLGLTPKPPSKPVTPPVVGGHPQLVVDGKLGPKTCKRLQQLLGLSQTGKMDDKTVKRVQTILREREDHKLAVDGDLGPKTIRALQKYLRSPVDGVISKPVSEVVKQLQRRLNTGKI